MAKKTIRREDFDEAAILNLIGGVDAPPRFVPKSSPAASPPETPPPETPADKERDIRRKLRLMVQLLGDKGISVTCLMNNILYHHLQDHRAEINMLIENSTKKIKL